MQTEEVTVDALSERIAKLEEHFVPLDFLANEMKNKILHFQTKRDLINSQSVLDFVEEEDYELYYFKGGSKPDFTMAGYIRGDSVKKITVAEYVSIIRLLPKIVVEPFLLQEFINLGGEFVLRERGKVKKELQEIKKDHEVLMDKRSGLRR